MSCLYFQHVCCSKSFELRNKNILKPLCCMMRYHVSISPSCFSPNIIIIKIIAGKASESIAVFVNYCSSMTAAGPLSRRFGIYTYGYFYYFNRYTRYDLWMAITTMAGQLINFKFNHVQTRFVCTTVYNARDWRCAFLFDHYYCRWNENAIISFKNIFLSNSFSPRRNVL